MPVEQSRYFIFTNWNVDFDYETALSGYLGAQRYPKGNRDP